MVMLDGHRITFYDIIGIHIQILRAHAKGEKLFIPSWRNIVIPFRDNLPDTVAYLINEEIEKSWLMLFYP